ncbi:hypothetical protein [Puia sp.]|uniref:hypothetical protein n=1 Tax=Puia sp. TaxID=2045100 RepID=UPI002F3E5FCC
MTLAGAHATEEATTSLEKDVTSYSVKIVYLSRRSGGNTVLAPIRAIRPVMPQAFALFVAAVWPAKDGFAANAPRFMHLDAVEGAPPGWTRQLRI